MPKSTRSGGKWRVFQTFLKFLKASMPIINFIILGDDRSYNRVYFGWRYVRDAQSERIYFSEDSNVVNLFDNYFNFLWTSPMVQEVGFLVKEQGATVGPKESGGEDDTSRPSTLRRKNSKPVSPHGKSAEDGKSTDILLARFSGGRRFGN
jgi:hypothetical protein